MTALRTRLRNLISCILLAIGSAASVPAAAQFSGFSDYSPYVMEAEDYFFQSLSNVAHAAIARRDFALASRLVRLLDEARPRNEVVAANTRQLFVSLAIDQAKAGDWKGADQTLLFLKDPFSRAEALTRTGALLAEQNRGFEARDRFVKVFHEMLMEADVTSKRYLLDLLITAVIHAGYRSMAHITLRYYESEFGQAMREYPPALMQFSRWNALNGDIDEALRWYRLIPSNAAKDSTGWGFGRPYSNNSPAAAIAAAYIEAGNPEAVWTLYDSTTDRQEKRQMLEAVLSSAMQSHAVSNLSELLMRVVRSADAFSWPDKQGLIVALIANLERSGSPLCRKFSDLRLYHWDAPDEARLRLGLAGSDIGAGRRSKAETWLKPLPRLLAEAADPETRSDILRSYAYPLHALRKNPAALRALREAASEASQIPTVPKRIAQWIYISSSQTQFGDAAGELETDRSILREAQTHESDVAPVTLSLLTRSLLRLHQEPEARSALDLLKRAAAAAQKASGMKTGYAEVIVRLEAEIAGAPSPVPPRPQSRPFVLGEALQIRNERDRAFQLNAYVTRLLAKRRIKEALQVLPLFPLTEVNRSLVKQELKL